ncbi:hypothetical protein [Mycolicibacterium hodleri]|uniref:PASTA domain-containing protein n=1 Tax=Mycolicibacterium hodleri TaxID=49897 RepID=A0A502E7Q2_9MYCO|nr:hypothetical protein [Mycolicibacterium hodleri]TPG33758.1 hypothetical protein EAH80_16100 [Mycolicibacterium hodleri]
MKKILGLGAAALFVPAAIASAALFAPGVAGASPGGNNSMNVVGEPYFKAVTILKSQGYRATFGGSFGSDLPQSQCIVSQQKATSKKMILMLDCTQAAGQEAAANAPASPGSGVAPGGTAPTPGNGQGTYGSPIGVPIPVG